MISSRAYGKDSNVTTSLAQHLFSLIKPRQTLMLLVTGLTGYISAKCPALNSATMLGLTGTLLLTISGSTILNMVYDRDIDAKMRRTRLRPLPCGDMDPRQALALGLGVSLLGLIWAAVLSPLYAAVIFAGLFLDVVVYTLWLKRKTPWSIVWGGLSGGMPILAGRVLSTGQIDTIGILFALAILLWIPTHILTFAQHYREDYANAGIPTFGSVYGPQVNSYIIAASSIAAALAMGLSIFALGLSWGYLRLLAVFACGITALALWSCCKPSHQANFGLFKCASFYMLASMMLVVAGSM